MRVRFDHQFADRVHHAVQPFQRDAYRLRLGDGSDIAFRRSHSADRLFVFRFRRCRHACNKVCAEAATENSSEICSGPAVKLAQAL